MIPAFIVDVYENAINNLPTIHIIRLANVEPPIPFTVVNMYSTEVKMAFEGRKKGWQERGGHDRGHPSRGRGDFR